MQPVDRCRPLGETISLSSMSHDGELESLEEALWRSETRGDSQWMDSVLSPDFVEHGRSGRVYDRDTAITVAVPDEIEVEIPLKDFATRMIGSDIALVTYVSVEPRGRSNRCSIWRRVDSKWLLEFHQGTPS